MNPYRTFILLCLFFLFNLPAMTYGDDMTGRRHNYYDDPRTCRGWFCYEDSQHPPELNPRENTPPDPPAVPGRIDFDRAWTMPPEELKKHINQALSWAQENPDDEQRMLAYLSLQGIAMRRAKRFQEAWSRALLRYPILDETVQRSPTQLGTSLEVIAEREERQTSITEMREQTGLLFFYSPGCPYCHKEKGILESFLKKWDWKHFTAINIQERPDLADQYKVMTVPDLWVVGNTSRGLLQERLKSGLAEHADIERGLLQAWNQWFGRKGYERPEMVKNLVPFKEFLESTPNIRDR